MSDVELIVLDAGLDGPENMPYVLLGRPGESHVLPLWLPNSTDRSDLVRLRSFTGESRRTMESLIDLCEKVGGVNKLEITNFHQGDVVVEAALASGVRFEVAAIDLVYLAQHFDTPVTMDESLFTSVAVFSSAEDLQEYFGVEVSTPAPQGESESGESDFEDHEGASSTSASGNAQADAEFKEMMRSLGMTDEDLDDGGSQ